MSAGTGNIGEAGLWDRFTHSDGLHPVRMIARGAATSIAASTFGFGGVVAAAIWGTAEAGIWGYNQIFGNPHDDDLKAAELVTELTARTPPTQERRAEIATQLTRYEGGEDLIPLLRADAPDQESIHREALALLPIIESRVTSRSGILARAPNDLRELQTAVGALTTNPTQRQIANAIAQMKAIDSTGFRQQIAYLENIVLHRSPVIESSVFNEQIIPLQRRLEVAVQFREGSAFRQQRQWSDWAIEQSEVATRTTRRVVSGRSDTRIVNFQQALSQLANARNEFVAHEQLLPHVERVLAAAPADGLLEDDAPITALVRSLEGYRNNPRAVDLPRLDDAAAVLGRNGYALSLASAFEGRRAIASMTEEVQERVERVVRTARRTMTLDISSSIVSFQEAIRTLENARTETTDPTRLKPLARVVIERHAALEDFPRDIRGTLAELQNFVDSADSSPLPSLDPIVTALSLEGYDPILGIANSAVLRGLEQAEAMPLIGPSIAGLRGAEAPSPLLRLFDGEACMEEVARAHPQFASAINDAHTVSQAQNAVAGVIGGDKEWGSDEDNKAIVEEYLAANPPQAAPAPEARGWVSELFGGVLSFIGKAPGPMATGALSFITDKVADFLDQKIRPAIRTQSALSPEQKRSVQGLITSTISELRGLESSGSLSDYAEAITRIQERFKSIPISVQGINVPHTFETIDLFIDDETTMLDQLERSRRGDAEPNLSWGAEMQEQTDALVVNSACMGIYTAVTKFLGEKNPRAELDEKLAEQNPHPTNTEAYKREREKLRRDYGYYDIPDVDPTYDQIMAEVKTKPVAERQEAFYAALSRELGNRKSSWLFYPVRFLVMPFLNWALPSILKRSADHTLTALRRGIEETRTQEHKPLNLGPIDKVTDFLTGYSRAMEEWGKDATGSRDNVLSSTLKAPKFNHGLDDPTLLDIFSGKVVDNYVPDIHLSDWTVENSAAINQFMKARVIDAEAPGAIVINTVAKPFQWLLGAVGHILNSVVAWPLLKGVETCYNPLCRVIVRSFVIQNDLLRTIADKTKNSLFDNSAYTNAISQVVCDQLREIWNLMDPRLDDTKMMMKAADTLPLLMAADDLTAEEYQAGIKCITDYDECMRRFEREGDGLEEKIPEGYREFREDALTELEVPLETNADGNYVSTEAFKASISKWDAYFNAQIDKQYHQEEYSLQHPEHSREELKKLVINLLSVLEKRKNMTPEQMRQAFAENPGLGVQIREGANELFLPDVIENVVMVLLKVYESVLTKDQMEKQVAKLLKLTNEAMEGGEAPTAEELDRQKQEALSTERMIEHYKDLILRVALNDAIDTKVYDPSADMRMKIRHYVNWYKRALTSEGHLTHDMHGQRIEENQISNWKALLQNDTDPCAAMMQLHEDFTKFRILMRDQGRELQQDQEIPDEVKVHFQTMRGNLKTELDAFQKEFLVVYDKQLALKEIAEVNPTIDLCLATLHGVHENFRSSTTPNFTDLDRKIDLVRQSIEELSARENQSEELKEQVLPRLRRTLNALGDLRHASGGEFRHAVDVETHLARIIEHKQAALQFAAERRNPLNIPMRNAQEEAAKVVKQELLQLLPRSYDAETFGAQIDQLLSAKDAAEVNTFAEQIRAHIVTLRRSDDTNISRQLDTFASLLPDLENHRQAYQRNINDAARAHEHDSSAALSKAQEALSRLESVAATIEMPPLVEFKPLWVPDNVIKNFIFNEMRHRSTELIKMVQDPNVFEGLIRHAVFHHGVKSLSTPDEYRALTGEN